MGMEAKTTLLKYQKLAQKRSNLKDQVDHLEKMMTGHQDPTELRFIISKYVTSGSSGGKVAISDDELSKFKSSTAAFKAPKFGSHSHGKKVAAFKKLQAKTK